MGYSSKIRLKKENVGRTETTKSHKDSFVRVYDELVGLLRSLSGKEFAPQKHRNMGSIPGSARSTGGK